MYHNHIILMLLVMMILMIIHMCIIYVCMYIYIYIYIYRERYSINLSLLKLEEREKSGGGLSGAPRGRPPHRLMEQSPSILIKRNSEIQSARCHEKKYT